MSESLTLGLLLCACLVSACGQEPTEDTMTSDSVLGTTTIRPQISELDSYRYLLQTIEMKPVIHYGGMIHWEETSRSEEFIEVDQPNQVASVSSANSQTTYPDEWASLDLRFDIASIAEQMGVIAPAPAPGLYGHTVYEFSTDLSQVNVDYYSDGRLNTIRVESSDSTGSVVRLITMRGTGYGPIDLPDEAENQEGLSQVIGDVHRDSTGRGLANEPAPPQ